MSFKTMDIHAMMPALSICAWGMVRKLNFCSAPSAFLRTELSADWPLIIATSSGTMSGSSNKYLQHVSMTAIYAVDK